MEAGKRHLVAKVLRTAEEVEKEVAGVMTGTTIDINNRCGVATTNILRHLKALNFAGQCHIHSWIQSRCTWVARWVVGPGENAPIPRRTAEELRERGRVYRSRERTVPINEITPSKALRLTDEWLAQAKQRPATWLSPLTM